VALAADEIVIKTYEGFETLDPIGKGFFTVTNRRSIYYSSSKDSETDSVTVSECPIESIGGINSEYGKRVKRVQKFFAVLFLLLAIGGIGFGIAGSVMKRDLFIYSGYIGGGLMLILAIILFVTCKRRIFSLEIFYKTPKTVMLSLTSDFFKAPNRSKIRVLPTSVTMQMIRELGKTILDAQNFHYLPGANLQK
jgi:hypothetical protein